MNSNPIRYALDQVAEELFGLSDMLLFQISADESIVATLPDLIRAETASPYYAARIRELRESLDEETKAHSVGPGAAPGIWKVRQMNRFPRAGEVRHVAGVDLNHPDSPALYTRPLLVVLDEPYVDADGDGTPAPDYWWAWVACSFAEFASWWDVVLQADDRPEACAMVQAWNRVVVAEQHLGNRIYTVAPAELQGIRAVWDEYASGDDPEEDIGEALGYLNLRDTLGDTGVVTGTPLRSADDPRVMFQSLYLRASDTVSAAAREALVARVTADEGPLTEGARKAWLRVKKLFNATPPLANGAYAASTPFARRGTGSETLAEFEDPRSGTLISIVVSRKDRLLRVALIAADPSYLEGATHLSWMDGTFVLVREGDAIFLDLTPSHARDLCVRAQTIDQGGTPCIHFTKSG